MYIADLDEMMEGPVGGVGVKSVAYLDPKHPFTTGQVAVELLKKLESITPRFRTAGHHLCEFCFPDGRHIGQNKESMSSCELQICSKEGQIYIAPKMIIHYIKTHNYLPPQEYLDALANGYTENEPEYKEATKETLNKLREKLRISIEERKHGKHAADNRKL